MRQEMKRHYFVFLALGLLIAGLLIFSACPQQASTPTLAPLPTPAPTSEPAPSPTATPIPCHAEFSADKCADTPCEGITKVHFTDLSIGQITSWLWDFGDGRTSYNQNPNHGYISSGSYQVTLTITGPDCSDTEVKADYIHITITSTPCG